MDKFTRDLIRPLLEDTNIKKIVGIYGGRFQPFGPHHKKVYEWLKKQFDDAYITTSNIKQLPRHPMNFKEKVRHMSMMGIPSNKIIMEKSPFVAKNLASKFDPKTTAFVYIFGAKDTGRLGGGKYFQDYKKNKNNLKGHEEHGYYLVAPHMSVSAGGLEVSGTAMRELLGHPKYKDQREKLFKKMFGYFNQGIYNMLTNKFSKIFEVAEDIEKINKKGKDGGEYRKYKKPKSDWDEPHQQNEGITIPVSIGDTIMMGRFKNKKVKVKSIDVNEKGDVLINGKSAMKFRIYQKGDSEEKGIEHYDDDIKITSEYLNHFLSKINLNKILNETNSIVSGGGKGHMDDGPAAYFKRLPAFKRDSHIMAKKLGMQVLRYILKSESDIDNNDNNPKYPNGPVGSVSYFPAGVGAKATATNQENLWGSKAWNKWIKHMRGCAQTVGYELIDQLTYMDWIDDIEDDVMDKETIDTSVEETPEDTKRNTPKLRGIKETLFSTDWWKREINETLMEGYRRYMNIRQYNKKELDNEVGEYFENDYTFNTIPGLAETPDELKEKIKNARLVYLNNNTLKDLHNSDVQGIINGSLKRTDAIKLLKSYGKDWKSVVVGLKHKGNFPAPIVVKDKDGRYLLMAGNTRLVIGLLAGYKLPVKVIDYNGSFLLKSQPTNENIVTKKMLQPRKKELLLMGGAYGHMAHPFDDKNLTFGDLKKIIELGLGGQLNREDGVTEKLDGQNIMVSWKDGKLIAARNKGHIKNGGKTALDAKGIRLKFAGRGNIADAFNFAMTDLSKAISSLSEKQRTKIFNNGYNFMNLEVMYPKSANVIDYDVATLVFHGALKYDDNATVIGEVPGSGRMLAGMIQQVNQHIQSKYSIGKPNFLTIPKHQDFGKLKAKFLSSLSRYQSKFGLKDKDTLGLYHQKWWEQFITKKSKGKLSPKILKGLTKRWAFFDKSYGVRNMKKDIKDEGFLEWVLTYDKENHAAQVKENMKPFEILFFQVGAEILKNVQGYIAASPNKAVQGIKKRLNAAIADVQSGGDIKKLNKLKTQMDRLNAIGGLESIVPSEGIVFKYKGNTYKFTGAFAPINQITGLMAF